jgi:hypothetical protein
MAQAISLVALIGGLLCLMGMVTSLMIRSGSKKDKA